MVTLRSETLLYMSTSQRAICIHHYFWADICVTKYTLHSSLQLLESTLLDVNAKFPTYDLTTLRLNDFTTLQDINKYE